MGSHSSKAVSEVTENITNAIQQNCASSSNLNQQLTCNIYLGPGCDGNLIQCGNNATTRFECTLDTHLDAIQSAMSTASASVKDQAFATWNKEHSSTYASSFEDIATQIGAFCGKTDNKWQETQAPINCFGKNNIIEVGNNANDYTQCLLSTAVSLMQQASATAKSSTTSGLSTGEIVAICVGIAVVLLAAGVGYYMYRRGKGIREAKKDGSGGTGATRATSGPVGDTGGTPETAGGRFGGLYGGRHGTNRGFAKYGSRCDWEW
jgi:hypothetical protein